ncbi:MAG: hypothetical protein P8N13_09515 [Ilumatobacter sp.]|nr:hypothetical protein [Ilumatobacter sp.]
MLYRAAALSVIVALAAGCGSSGSVAEVASSGSVVQTDLSTSGAGYTAVTSKLDGDDVRYLFYVDSDVIERELDGVTTVLSPSGYCAEAHVGVSVGLAEWLEGSPEVGSRHHLVGAEEFSFSAGVDGTAGRVVTFDPLAVGDVVMLTDLCGDGTSAGALEALSSIFLGRVVADESDGTDFSYELERISPLAAGMPVGEKANDSDSGGTDEPAGELDVAPVSGVPSTKAQDCSVIPSTHLELNGDTQVFTGGYLPSDDDIDINDPETVVTEYLEDCTVVQSVGGVETVYDAGEFCVVADRQRREQADALSPAEMAGVDLERVGFFYGAEEFRIISGGNSSEGGSGEATIWTKTPLAVGDGIIAADSCLTDDLVKGIYYGVVTADVSDGTGFVYEASEEGLVYLVGLSLFG